MHPGRKFSLDGHLVGSKAPPVSTLRTTSRTPDA
jgi:hypothetical protein